MSDDKDPREAYMLALRQRVTACQAEINAVLASYDCHLEAQVVIGAQGTTPRVLVVPNDKLGGQA